MVFYNIWNVKYEKAEKIYAGDNWKSVLNENVNNNDCFIYFSSNNVWFPNEERAFDRSFVDNDYYEWAGTKKACRKKEIYVRDIYKQWYVTGINDRVDSIDKLYLLLKRETEGMRIVTVGSSAGGYMAALMGALLKAEYILCFSAQYYLWDQAKQPENFFLVKYADDVERNKYYDIVDYMRQSKSIFYYIMPAYADTDIYQSKFVDGLENVRILRIASKHHGVPVLKENLNALLVMDKQGLERLFSDKKGKAVSPIMLSIDTNGVFSTVNDLLLMLRKKLKRK